MKYDKVLTIVEEGKLIHIGEPSKFDTELLAEYCRRGCEIKTFTLDEFRISGWELYKPIPTSFTAADMQAAREDAWEACERSMIDNSDVEYNFIDFYWDVKFDNCRIEKEKINYLKQFEQ